MSGIHLHLHHLAVGYNGRALIHGIEIGVRRGEIVTLVGPNGAGKSTILKSITQQLEPVDGEVFLQLSGEEGEEPLPVSSEDDRRKTSPGKTAFGGRAAAAAGRKDLSSFGGREAAVTGRKDLSGFGGREAADAGMRELSSLSPAELAKRMAVVLTGRIRTELMTCRDVAAMGRYPYTGRLGILSALDERKVEEALAAVHAQHLANRPFDAISDGERQRILLARAICQEPEIIVLDEPTSFLDIRHKLELLSILYNMAREQQITVVMSLHEIDLAMKISDRILCVRGEEVFACGAPSEVLDDETVRRLYDLDPALGNFDTATGSLELAFKRNKEEAGSAASPRLMIAAPGSGSGKTLLTCGLLRLLQRRGLHPVAFKCGPDYIDPMFHRQVLGLPSRNLDTFFSPGGEARAILEKTARRQSADLSVIEGVMGYFDGTGPDGMQASSRDLAVQTAAPVILVVNARGMGRSVVPLLRGFEEYDRKNPGNAENPSDTGKMPSEDAGSSLKGDRGSAGIETFAGGKKSGGQIRGVILNHISRGMAPRMKEWIEEETRLRVVGFLPHDTSFSWGSRHLGLLLPEEVADLQGQIDHLADVMEETIDMDALLEIAGWTGKKASDPGPGQPEKPEQAEQSEEAEKPGQPERLGEAENPGRAERSEEAEKPEKEEDAVTTAANVRIAVARDEAFNFYYEDNLELLQECGAELVFFSPLHDRNLPEADGLLLGGGYPELHAQALSENESMKEQIRRRADEGMPILAECGGFMYLQEALLLPDDGDISPDGRKISPDKVEKKACRRYEMCGVLPGTCRKTDRLVRFGYLELSPGEMNAESGKGLYLEPRQTIRGHEFHYFDSTRNGNTCTAVKPGKSRAWQCMVLQGNIMAGFPHLYYRSNPSFVWNFLERCRNVRTGS